ncbi:PREDICTED: cell cycle checkpoint control protein RAD9B [Gekko japonicus]|uniref:Cell cycle checkpoint control protein n=1 Tax=Gekko japonicus TaxID=146911 RepID=A0ABM1KHE0_GEKJA|nr:PREDICTED: cell cycle checkpoint control protein RAD9B [Gekko japonicus]
MKCGMGGPLVRVFGRAIYALARISDEFWFDPIEKGLFLRSVNSSRSAYACVFFSSMFFQHYSWRNSTEQCLNENSIRLRCKLTIKAVLPIFRYSNSLEKNVDKCNIYTNFKDCHVVFQLFCKHGIVKTHNLSFQECEPLQAVFAKHLCPNVLKVHSRQLSDILIHFPTYQDEVTLSVTPLKACFKTYVEDEMDFTKAMRTEIHLEPEEFEYFQVGVDSEVTFCLKELKGLLAFADILSASVTVHLDVSGKPVAFSIEDMMVEASFVLATLADTENKEPSPHSPRLSQGQKRSPALRRSKGGTLIPSTGVPGPTPARTTAEDATAVGEAVPTRPDYSEFHSLFFGAVSSQEPDTPRAFHSLATASDTEEDFCSGQLSQSF